jgi:hypothetical protein
MNFILLETNGWWVIATPAIIVVVIVSVLFLSVRRRRNRRPLHTIQKPIPFRSADISIVQQEIDRMLAGRPDDVAIKQLSRESRILFEVSVIDLLMNASHEQRQLVRTALVKCGYDEHCARRVMSEEISDRIRASTLLNLLRQPRESGADGVVKAVQPKSAARAAVSATDINSGATLEPSRSDHSGSNPLPSDS